MAMKPTTATCDLEFPVEHEGRLYETLTFRRMRAGDTLVAEGEERPAMAGCLIFAALADVDVEVILKLDMEDFEKVGEVVAPLMGKSARAAAEAATKAA